jgi:hypothetical protein
MSDIQSEWQEDLADCNPNVEVFGRNTYGSHELMDRTSLLLESWESYVLDHPSCVLNFELYQRATEIINLMCDFYQIAAENDCPLEENTDE